MNSPLSASLVKTIPNLYEQDYYLWIDKTIQQLRDGKLSELDINNLIEEIADMGRNDIMLKFLILPINKLEN